MPACTPPRVASRDVACAAFRRWRLGSAWVLLLLLLLVAAAAAATSAYADGSGDTSPVCADYSCYTQDQAFATYTALSGLGGSVNGLNAYWGSRISSSFCSYTGVTCRYTGVTVTASNVQLIGSLPEVTDLGAFNSMVTSLDLHNNLGIDGTLPPSWSSYTALRRFMMSGTSLGGSLPSEWSALSQLQTVDLQNTGLSGTLPDSWSSLTLLTALRLHSTYVAGTLPAGWGSMAVLMELSLHSTQVSGALPSAWGSMQQLETLLLNGTLVSGTLPVHWGSMTVLKSLSLCSTRITGSLPAEWAGMVNLQILLLNDTLLAGVLPTKWGSMVRLKALHLRATSVSGSLPAAWGSMAALTELSLTSTVVSGLLPDAWASMRALKVLTLDGTQVSGTLPDSWSSMAQLETLLLNGTRVSGTIPESWGALKSLRALSLSGTSVVGCLPEAWVCDLGWTEAGVGLTSESSSNCTSVAQWCRGGSSGRRKWVIPVAVVCSVVGALLLVLLAYCCWRSHKTKTEPERTGKASPSCLSSAAEKSAPQRIDAKAALPPSAAQYVSPVGMAEATGRGGVPQSVNAAPDGARRLASRTPKLAGVTASRTSGHARAPDAQAARRAREASFGTGTTSKTAPHGAYAEDVPLGPWHIGDYELWGGEKVAAPVAAPPRSPPPPPPPAVVVPVPLLQSDDAVSSNEWSVQVPASHVVAPTRGSDGNPLARRGDPTMLPPLSPTPPMMMYRALSGTNSSTVRSDLDYL